MNLVKDFRQWLLWIKLRFFRYFSFDDSPSLLRLFKEGDNVRIKALNTTGQVVLVDWSFYRIIDGNPHYCYRYWVLEDDSSRVAYYFSKELEKLETREN